MGKGSVPAQPDPAAAAVGGIASDAANFPFTQIINSLAQTGGKATIGGQTYDFTGQGNADVSNTLSDQGAQALLDIQNNYGSQFVTQRLADLKQSDPTGYAAHQQLFDSIMADANANPDRPLADALQKQVTSTLQGAGQLDDQGVREVQQSTRAGQAASGIILGNAPATQEADNLVTASENLKSQQQQSAQSYLSSGVSPQDVEYRRIQQSLSNLGAFTNSQTPEANFASLSSAGNGAAPSNAPNFTNPAMINPNAASTGLNFAANTFQQQSGFANTQANPFLTGLTTAVNGVNSVAGFTNNFTTNPFAPGGNGGFSNPGTSSGQVG